MKGENVKAKQQEMLEKQSNMFRQLRENDELASDRNSVRGTAMQFAAKSRFGAAVSRQSNTSLFMHTIQAGQDELIKTEID